MENRLGRLGWLLAAMTLATTAACGGGGGGEDEGCTTHADCPAQQYCSDAGACVAEANPGLSCHKVADCAATYTCEANVCTPPVVAECDKAANVARRAELVAAQPAIGVRAGTGKTAKTFTTTFASVAGEPSVQCEVQLTFKDLNNDGALQGYEDWTRTPAERAEDLAGRMTSAEKLALMVHPVLGDAPTTAASAPSAATTALVDAGVRFGQTTAFASQVTPRANWANAIQERCEASALGVPFVLSMDPAHANVGGRAVAKGYSQWPAPLGFGAAGDAVLVRSFGQVVSQEYRAVGVRMALNVSADLATDPRWWGSQHTFGEDSATVATLVDAYVNGLQGATLGRTGVAAVVGGFPGAGAAKGGFDARFEKGKYLSYSGTHLDEHLAPFEAAFDGGVAGVMPSYGLPEAGAWTALAGAVDGTAVEQVAASFNDDLLGAVLRGHYAYAGLVVAPAGVLEDAGLSPLGAPWGVEGLTKAQRVAKAVGAGVDQFQGLAETDALAAAGLTAGQVDASARRALAVAFQLGLFEDPYVNAAAAPGLCNADSAKSAALDAMDRSLVLVRNELKPTGWLNGTGDGTQTGDTGNAGNGSLRVLPAPPGQVYVQAGCDYYIAGDFDIDYVTSVGTGYGNMTNDASIVKGVAAPDAASRMALSDYVFVRIDAPFTADADTGTFAHALPSLTWAGNDASVLAPIQAARAAIDGWAGPPESKAQIVVIVDSGRPSVLDELLEPALGVSGIYLSWVGQTPPNIVDKIVLDVAFGIVNGRGKLPVGLPGSDAEAAAQLPDVAGDGVGAPFARTFGFDTNKF